MNNYFARLLEDINRRPRFYLIRLAIAIVLALVTWNLYLYLTTGTITITTTTENSVTIRDLSKGNEEKKLSDGKVKFRKKPGEYVLTVSSRVGVIKQKIYIKARKHDSYTIEPTRPLSVEPVQSKGLFALSSSSSGIYFQDYLDNKLQHIAASGLPEPLAGSPGFKGAVQWSSPDVGVGLAVPENTLYSVEKGKFTKLNLPISYSTDSRFTTTSSGDIYFTDGNSIYKKGTGSNGFINIEKTYEGISKIGGIYRAGNSIMLAADSPGDDDLQSTKVSIINSNGDLLASKEISLGYNHEWSPSGKYLAVSDHSRTVVYNAELNQTDVLPDPNVLSMAWLDDSTIIYSLGSKVFRYELSNSKTEQVADVGLENGVSALYIDKDAKELYLEVEKNTSSRTLRRIGRVSLVNKKAESYLYGLEAFFPANYRDCDLGYLNFTKHIITYSSSNNAPECIKTAQKELKQDSLPPESFSILPKPIEAQPSD